MSIKPILFNTDMIRAILDGRKTVTRRKIDIDISNKFDVEKDGKTVVAYINQATGDSFEPGEICMYKPGDILYVRETWQYIDFAGEENGYVYKASENGQLWEMESERWTWRPSIHMPKEAARIWLKVTDVRVERLQDISPEQLRREGMKINFLHKELKDQFNKLGAIFDVKEKKEKFCKLWNSTIKKSDISRYGWDANPWVWVIEFEQCDKPE